MSGAIKDDPALRRDLRIARNLGIPVRKFWGLTTDHRYDEWERALWRALDDWEQDRCPGCGQPMSESVFPAKKDKPTYAGAFYECAGCEAVEAAQIRQAELDEEARKSRGKDAPASPTRHRRYYPHRIH